MAQGCGTALVSLDGKAARESFPATHTPSAQFGCELLKHRDRQAMGGFLSEPRARVLVYPFSGTLGVAAPTDPNSAARTTWPSD